MLGKSDFFLAVDRCRVLPGPAAKFGASVVGKGLVNFGLRVHDEWAVLRNGFGDGGALQHQKFCHLRAVNQRDVHRGVQLQGRVFGDGLAVHREGAAFEKIQLPTGTRAAGFR